MHMYKYVLGLLHLSLATGAYAASPSVHNDIAPPSGAEGAASRVAEHALILVNVNEQGFRPVSYGRTSSSLPGLEDGDMYQVRVVMDGSAYTTKPLLFDAVASNQLVVTGVGLPRRVLTGQDELLATDKDYGIFYDESGRSIRYVSCGGASVAVTGGFRCDIEGLGYFAGQSLGFGILAVFAGDTAVNDRVWRETREGGICSGNWWGAVLYTSFSLSCSKNELFSMKRFGWGTGAGTVSMEKISY